MKRLIIAILLVLPTVLSAQDRIVLTDGSAITARIERIGDKSVDYKAWSNLNGPTYTLDTERIASIRLQDGEEQHFNPAPIELNNFEGEEHRSGRRNRREMLSYDGRGNLYLDGRQLDQQQARELLNADGRTMYDQWQRGIRQRKAGLWCSIVGTGLGIAGIAITASGTTFEHDGPAGGYICTALGSASLLTGSILYGSGTANCNRVLFYWNGWWDRGWTNRPSRFYMGSDDAGLGIGVAF